MEDWIIQLADINMFMGNPKVCQKVVYVRKVFGNYFLNQYRYSRNQDIVGKLAERQIFLKFQILVDLIQTGVIDDQSFEFPVNNFAGLTNITSNI